MKKYYKNKKLEIMKPLVNKKQIRKVKYKYHWYKNMVKMLRNSGIKNYRNDSIINLI